LTKIINIRIFKLETYFFANDTTSGERCNVLKNFFSTIAEGTAVRERQERGLHTAYGDAMDPDIALAVPVQKARWVVAAVPGHRTALTHDDPRLTLLGTLQSNEFAGKVAVTADTEKEAGVLREKGADLVLMPFRDAADQAVDLLLGRNRRGVAPEPVAVAERDGAEGAF